MSAPLVSEITDAAELAKGCDSFWDWDGIPVCCSAFVCAVVEPTGNRTVRPSFPESEGLTPVTREQFLSAASKILKKAAP
jgi:hypothetical protein